MTGDYKNFRSVQNFKKNIKETLEYTQKIRTSMFITDKLMGLFESRGLIRSKKEKEYAAILKNDQRLEDYLFGISFINMYSHFEYFMYDFVYDLLSKYPESMENLENMGYKELAGFKSIRQLRKYLRDKAAIKNSYDLEKWKNFLENHYKIFPFKSKSDYKYILFLDNLRNDLEHSGGTLSSLTYEKLKKMGAMDKFTKTRKKSGIFTGMKKTFLATGNFFLHIVENLEKVN